MRRFSENAVDSKSARQAAKLFWLCSPAFTVIFAMVLRLLPVSQPVLYVDVQSSTAGMSQVFYKKVGGSYSGDWVVNNSMSIGRQLLAFDLPYYRDPVRWDPPNAPGSFLVHDMWLKIWWLSMRIDLGSLSGERHIASIIKGPEGIHISTTTDAFDPQLVFTVDARRIDVWRWGVSVITAGISALLIGCALMYRSRVRTWGDRIDQVLARMMESFRGESFGLSEFAILAGIVLALNLYSLSSFSLSIDDEYAAFRDRPDVWIGQGRWTVYLVERFVFSQPVMPYVPNLVFSVLIALAYMLIVRAHGLARDWRTYLSFPIFCGFPTWWFIAEFYSNLPSVGLGVFLVSASVFAFARLERSWAGAQRTGVLLGSFAVQAVLLAVAIGAYQSLLLMHISMGIGIVLLGLMSSDKGDGHDVRTAIWSIVRLGMVAGLGLAIYLTVNAFMQWLIPSSREYIEGFWRLGELVRNPVSVIGRTILQMQSIYTGSTSTYGASLASVGVLMVASGLVVVAQSWARGTVRFLLASLLWLAIPIIPFFLNFVSGGTVATRSLLAIAYVIWLLALLALSSRRAILLTAAVVLVLVLQVQMVRATGMYAAISSIAQEHDRMLAADLYRRMGEVDDNFNRNQFILVDFYGTKSVETVYAFPWSSTMGASFFDWDGGNAGRMASFMRLLGYTNIGVLDTDRRLQMTRVFETMPAWPAAGSVRKVDGVFLIKLGNRPDPVHALAASEEKK